MRLGHQPPSATCEEVGQDQLASLGLDECVLLLTKKHGTLKAAFDKLDFFQDGRLSCLEWQEGLRRLLSAGTQAETGRSEILRESKRLCDAALARLFKAMDKDKDGFISYTDLANAKGGPALGSRELRKKEGEDKTMVLHKSPRSPRFMQESSSLNLTVLPSMSRTKKAGKEHFAGHVYSDVRAFAALLVKKFDSLDKAYSYFDGNKNQQLGMTEFVSGARALRFAGDARSVFKELDRNNNGNISIQEFKILRALHVSEDEAVESKTRREQVLERKQRSPILPPNKHQRSICLASTHVQFPEAEHISSSAGFFSFPRAGTGRADLQLHPDEIPGFDSENFTKERGPGYCKKGPEYFAEVMPDSHPLRGSKFKVGSTVPRAERFGPPIPSSEGRKDMEHSAASFATYEGRMPRMSWRIDGTGAQIFLSKQERVGLTTGGFYDSFRLSKSHSWDKSRTMLKLKSQSESFLR
mmetsp:Transcript_14910/g.27984  ORF Transcript_14910/g.27984 Transcript_14910/m.27984 type:complete len:469 (-) Transcript_14910:131-1537(-)